MDESNELEDKRDCSLLISHHPLTTTASTIAGVCRTSFEMSFNFVCFVVVCWCQKWAKTTSTDWMEYKHFVRKLVARARHFCGTQRGVGYPGDPGEWVETDRHKIRLDRWMANTSIERTQRISASNQPESGVECQYIIFDLHFSLRRQTNESIHFRHWSCDIRQRRLIKYNHISLFREQTKNCSVVRLLLSFCHSILHSNNKY